jgi:uncharacterized delta-60 repeat protein
MKDKRVHRQNPFVIKTSAVLKIQSMLLAFCLTSFILYGQDGSLDPEFGNGGTRVFKFHDKNSEILSLIKEDDFLLAAGFTRPDANERISVVRTDLNGSLDMSFGIGGVAVFTIGSGFSRATKILRQSKGKYLVAGYARTGNKVSYVLLRMSSNGDLDTTFATQGIAIGNWNTSTFAEDQPRDMAIASDGTIYLTGRSYNGANEDIVVAAFTPDGSLDTTFSSKGFAIIEYSGGNKYEKGSSLAVSEEGDLVIAGSVSLNLFEENSFFLLKLDATGAPIVTFGDSGWVIHSIDANTVAGLQKIAIDGQGRIVTGGGAFDTDVLDNNFFMTRYLANGNIDKTFGNDGVAILQRSSLESITDLAILSSGQIIAAGSTGGAPSQFALVRMTSNGEHDLSFGQDGWVTTMIQSTFNGINALAIDESSIYAGGCSYAGFFSMTLAKYSFMTTSTASDMKQHEPVLITPHPIVSDEFEIALPSEVLVDEQISITLYDLSGKKITKLDELTLSGGAARLRLPAHILDGLYILQMTTDRRQYAEKIVICRMGQ